MILVDAEAQEKHAAAAKSFLDGLLATPLQSPDFQMKLAQLTRLGEGAMQQASTASNRMHPAQYGGRPAAERENPNEELVEQLQLLSGQAEALHSNRHSHTSAELTNTGNFLRERFGHHQRGGFDFGVE